MQRRLMYFPTAHVPAPDDIGLTPVEPVTFETSDGLELSGWFLAVSGPPPPLSVLVFNGNAGNRADRGPLAAALHRYGLQVLLVDYRSYGGNPGTSSESGPGGLGPLREMVAKRRSSRSWSWISVSLSRRSDICSSTG